MLLVALGSKKGIYRTITTNSEFLLREDEGGMTPPELWLEAKGDTLQVGFQFLRGNSTYSFIHKNNNLICVRSDQAGASGSGYMEVVHIDLISNVAERWTGRVDMDQLNREREIVIPPHPPISLSSMKPAMSTELVPGFFF